MTGPGARGEAPPPGQGIDNAPAAAGEIRGSTILLGGRVLALATNTTTQLLIVRALTKPEYGAFAFALALVPFVRTLLSLGHSQTLTRFLSVYDERGEHHKLTGTLVMVIGTIVGGAVLLFLLVTTLRERLVGVLVDDPLAASVLVVMVLIGPLEALDRVFESVFAVFSKPRSIFFRKYLLNPLLRLAVVLLLLAFGAGVRFLAVGYVAAGAVGVALYASMLVPTLRRRGLLSSFSPKVVVLPFREVYGFSFPLLTTELVNISINTVSVVLLARVASTVAVAELRAILPAARLNQFVLFSFTLLFAPLAARLYARGDQEGMRDAYWQTAVWLAVASFPVFALTGPLAAPLTVTLLGQRYADSATYLALLAVGYYVNAAFGFNALTLQTFGQLRYVVTVNVLAAVANVLLVVALAPRYLALGVAIANASTLVLQNVLNQAGLGRGIGVGVFDRRYLQVYATVVLAAGGLWAMQAALSPPLWLGFIVAAAVSVLVAVANRSLLRVGATFPELLRIPLVRRLFA